MADKRFYRKVARANRLIKSTQKYYKGKKGTNVLDKIEHSLKMIYGKDYKEMKFFTPRHAPKERLDEIENALDLVINSPYTTSRGRKKIQKQIESTLVDKGYIDKKNSNLIFEIFQSEEYEKVRELYEGYSETAIDSINDMASNGFKKEDIISTLQEFLSSNKDISLREIVDDKIYMDR